MRISDWSSDVCSSDLSTKLDGISAAAIKMTAAGSTSIDKRAFADAVDLGLSELRRLGEDINQLQREAATEMESTITRLNRLQNGRESCRERECQYVCISVRAVAHKIKINQQVT